MYPECKLKACPDPEPVFNRRTKVCRTCQHKIYERRIGRTAKTSRFYHRWTKEEVQRLREKYHSLSHSELAKLFNRDRISVQNKGAELGLRKIWPHTTVLSLSLSNLVNKPKVSGAYAIKNTANGRFFIGVSDDAHRLAATHLRILDSGSHISKELQSDYLHDGFVFFLCFAGTLDKAKVAENEIRATYPPEMIYNPTLIV